MRKVLGLFLLIGTLPLLAQSPLGSVTGLATDPSGAPVPQAQVALTNAATGVKRETRTNATGNYVFTNLPPGDYSLAAEAQGFGTMEISTFPVAAYRTVRQDLGFKVASVSTEVNVTASASAVIQQEAPNVASGLSTRQILELPTNLRSIYNNSGDSGLIANIMPMTIPGVVQMGNGAYWMSPGAGPGGLRLKVDGIETNFGNFGSADPVSQPSMESVEEFTANLVSNKAEFGGLGSVTTVTKAGTNSWHGDVFWFLRNSALDARNAFQTTKPFQNLHNYGVSMGGPIKKDKTFLYGTYEGNRGVRSYLFNSNVPTLDWRQGNFGSAIVRDPYNNNAPFANNVIPASRITPEAQSAQSLLYPLPNFGAPSLTAGNYRASFTGPEVHHILEGRLDHYFTPGHSIFGRYQFKKDDYDIPGARGVLPPTTLGTSTNIREMSFFTLGDAWTISPSVFNEFRAGVVTLTSKSSADVQGQTLLDGIGIEGLPPRPGAPGVPVFSVTGLSQYRQTLLNPVIDAHWQLSDNVSWVNGRHTFKFGVEFSRWMVNRYQPSSAGLYGDFNFQNRFTGQPYGDFLMGLPTTVGRLDPFQPQRFRWNNISFYAQDDWKISSRFSLSYGIRYEYNQPGTAEDDNFYSFDLASGSIVVPSEESKKWFSPFFPSSLPVITADKLGLDRSLRKADTNNWAPRAGFSYLLDSAGKTVLRGGAGFYYNSYSVAALGSLTSGPYAISTTANNQFVSGQPLFTLANPFAVPGASGTLNINGLVPNLLNMRSFQMNLSLEREITSSLGLRVSYIGTKGTQLAYMRNVNQPLASTVPFAQSRRPYPAFNNIIYADNGANNAYHGLQIGVTKRFSKGLQFASNYVFAKQLSEVDDTDNAELFTRIEDAYNRSRDRGRTYSVPSHQWMNNALYELPFGKGKLWGGWQLNALINLQSGHWLNPNFTGSDPSNTNNFGGRPDLPGDLSYPGTLSAWFDRLAFTVPTGGRFGTSGRNVIEGPGFVVVNFGVNKTTSFEKLGSLQIGASFQNVVNQVNYGQPNLNVNVSQGGTITSGHIFAPAGTARTGMLTLRWRY